MNARSTTICILAAAAVLIAGAGPMSAAPEHLSRLEHQRSMQQEEVRQRFDQAVVMLHARQYEHAVTALHRLLELAPNLPEAHVNMGYALLGLSQPDAARASFMAATDLRPQQANAYYGLALAEEARNDYEAALGGMRTYLHLAPAADPHVARARAALWEWEAKLGRVTRPAPSGSRTP
jgi:Flp pilus assembly protein TadD